MELLSQKTARTILQFPLLACPRCRAGIGGGQLEAWSLPPPRPRHIGRPPFHRERRFVPDRLLAPRLGAGRKAGINSWWTCVGSVVERTVSPRVRNALFYRLGARARLEVRLFGSCSASRNARGKIKRIRGLSKPLNPNNSPGATPAVPHPYSLFPIPSLFTPPSLTRR